MGESLDVVVKLMWNQTINGNSENNNDQLSGNFNRLEN